MAQYDRVWLSTSSSKRNVNTDGIDCSGCNEFSALVDISFYEKSVVLVSQFLNKIGKRLGKRDIGK